MPKGTGSKGPKGTGRPRKPLPGDEGEQVINDAAEQLAAMAGIGLTREKMALILGVSEDTLSRRLDDPVRPDLLRGIKKGEALAEANVGEARYNEAVGVKDVDPVTGQVRRWPSGQVRYLVRPNLGAIVWTDKVQFGKRERVGFEDETPRRPGELPQVPLETLREATRAAEAAAAKGKVLPFQRKKEASA